MYGDSGINLACDEASWVVDSGAAFHCTSRKDFFTSYTPGDFGVLRMEMMACQRFLASELFA